MRFRVKTTGVALTVLAVVGLLIGLLLGRVEFFQQKTVTSNPKPPISSQYFDFQPEQSTKTTSTKANSPSHDSDSRLKQLTTPPSPKAAIANPDSNSQQGVKNNQNSKSLNTPSFSLKTTAAFLAYKPKYEIAWANPTNYGERFATDVDGTVVNNPPIIVLHETAAPASSAINFFTTSHDDENVQASYHTMIKLDGTVIYIVPPDKRAFGAGNSVFDGPLGSETVKTNPHLPPSVNNFAYHIGLETPPSGVMNEELTHSGYTLEQYESLAWLIAQSSVPDERITTHRKVDRSGQRIDPRSFDFDKFWNVLHSFRVITRNPHPPLSPLSKGG